MTTPQKINKTITSSFIDILSDLSVPEAILTLEKYLKLYPEGELKIKADYDSEGPMLLLIHSRLETSEETEARILQESKYANNKKQREVSELTFLANKLGYTVVENPSLENING